jgi:SNF2 family DNA or RNA helicase
MVMDYENNNTSQDDSSLRSSDDSDDDDVPENDTSISIENKVAIIKSNIKLTKLDISTVASSSITSNKGKATTRKPTSIPNRYKSTPYFIKSDCEMRADQLEDLNWLMALQKHGVNGILNDQTGIKSNSTLPIIAFFAHLKKVLHVKGPHLLVVSSESEIYYWLDEFQKWCPSLRVVTFSSFPDANKKEKKRSKIELKKKNWDVCITLLNTERILLTSNAFKWNYVVIDNAERIKNEKTLISKTVRNLNNQNRILITSKPLSTFNFGQLWALLNFMDPTRFNNRHDYVDRQVELGAAIKPFIRCHEAALQEQQPQQLLNQPQLKEKLPSAEISDDWFQALLDDFMPAKTN